MAKYEPQLTAFLDILGTKDAVLGGNRMDDSLLKLLVAVAQLKSEFTKRETRIGSTNSRIDITPAVTAFSDHIVMSLPLSTISELGNDYAYSELALFISRRTGRIAARALELGYLLRGGLAVDDLYHASSVVYGKALIEAYRVESEIAIYPRVVLSPSLITPKSWAGFADIERDEHDGLYYLDYLSRLVYDQSQVSNERDKEHGREWYLAVCRVIRDRLDSHARSQRIKELSKWTWFANHFRQCLQSKPEIVVGLDWNPDELPKC